MPETHKYKQHKTRTTDTLWTYKYKSNQNQLIMGKSNSQTDPRNWVHWKDHNRWNMNRCNLGYTNQSKEANKKATGFQSNAQCIVWQHKNFTNIPKTRAMKGISWTRSKQESYPIPIKHTVYCMATQKFYQYSKN